MAVLEISILAFGSLVGALIIWAFMSQREARLVDAAKAESAALLAAAEAREQLLEESKDTMIKQMENVFKIAASNAFSTAVKDADEKNESSFKQATEALSTSLGQYMQAIQDAKEKDIQRAATLGEKVDNVNALGTTLAEETRELSLALRGDSQAQGAWGEVVVENLLQSMGFVEGSDYIKQFSETGTDGKRKRTDFILNLPDKRQVIIDSKVSLTAYTEYVNAEDEASSKLAIKAHCASIRKHVTGLASKNYEHMDGINTLDFVLMVVPLESAFIDAMREDPGLYEDLVVNRRVKVVSGTSLMLVLMLIQELWKRENQSRNQLELVKRAGALHDKVVLFLESFTDVGYEIKQANTAFETARTRLISGDGNVIRQTEMLRELGAKTTKDLREKSGIEQLAEEAESNHHESNLELSRVSMVTVEAEEE
ncbi:MAG TPA: DNA recombination protein RmuC [Candidatus Thalassarchaeaceae archaeon]|nr:DNA recombination protein RmuC [Candidatus Thalassarchaeaceae archaeon]